MIRTLLAASVLTGVIVVAQEPAKKYKAGDMKRPRPAIITPGEGTSPPSDAIALFDGKDFKAWKKSGKTDDAPVWKIEDSYCEVTPKGGRIETKQTFGDAQFHIEWATPKTVTRSGQGRGNSGVHLGGFGEIQVLDSFENDTYPDGQAAALYGKWPPLVNACRKPGEWQTYDILVRLPKVEEGKVVKPGQVTVLHNGVVVHHAAEFGNKIGEYTLQLSDHGNPVRFRNIWARKLKGYDER